jgi:trehalose 6-phosphate phosphatase
MQTNVATCASPNEEHRPHPDALRSIALLLDIDGTIIDIAATPASVVVPDSLRVSLQSLHAKTGGALALVSGRLLGDIDRLFAPLRLPAIGGHGAQMRIAGEQATQSRPPGDIGADLRRALAAIAACDPRIIVEDKEWSLAVHYRLAPHREQWVKDEIALAVERTRSQNLEMLHGKSVIELKPPNFNKGLAVLELMKHPPFARRQPVFIGDDTTDRSVFAILPELGGLGYSVGQPIAGTNGSFNAPRDVRGWLAHLCGCHEQQTR